MIKFAFVCGLVATLMGLLAFLMNWYLWDFWGGPFPGYDVLLFPGNLSLIYIWHPLFTEEIALYPKLGLMLLAQFIFVAVIGMIIKILIEKVSR